MWILEHFLSAEVESEVGVWVCRVPSHSNPADGPSRGVCPSFLAQAQQVKVDVGMLAALASAA